MNTCFTLSDFSFTREASSGGISWLKTVQKAFQKIQYDMKSCCTWIILFKLSARITVSPSPNKAAEKSGSPPLFHASELGNCNPHAVTRRTSWLNPGANTDTAQSTRQSYLNSQYQKLAWINKDKWLRNLWDSQVFRHERT